MDLGNHPITRAIWQIVIRNKGKIAFYGSTNLKTTCTSKNKRVQPD
jgi:hypothetical protein